MSLQPFTGRPDRPTWELTVVGAEDVTPRMRRVSLIGDALTTFSHRPGQDLVLSLPGGPLGPARRHYTIRNFDRAELKLDIDFVLHGDSPATRWARGAKVGETITAQGPRGRTVVHPSAAWHLFTGDETALPGIAAMIESLPRGALAFAIIEVAAAEDEQPIETEAELRIRWLHRGGSAGAKSQALVDALERFELPKEADAGHAYIIGETATVRAQRQGLIARGFAKSQIAAEGYWRPGRVGGHDHILDADVFGALGRARGRRFG
jgi:NADPH-dependent ferric siderophore reductase